MSHWNDGNSRDAHSGLLSTAVSHGRQLWERLKYFRAEPPEQHPSQVLSTLSRRSSGYRQLSFADDPGPIDDLSTSAAFQYPCRTGETSTGAAQPPAAAHLPATSESRQRHLMVYGPPSPSTTALGRRPEQDLWSSPGALRGRDWSKQSEYTKWRRSERNTHPEIPDVADDDGEPPIVNLHTGTYTSNNPDPGQGGSDGVSEAGSGGVADEGEDGCFSCFNPSDFFGGGDFCDGAGDCGCGGF